jgi:hypothetical protein
MVIRHNFLPVAAGQQSQFIESSISLSAALAALGILIAFNPGITP